MNRDFIRPDERVPREISAAPPLWVALACLFGFFCLFLWALPDLAAWLAGIGACR